MSRALCVTLVLGLASMSVRADEEKDAGPANPAREILEKAGAACKAIRSVEYYVAGSADGAMATRFRSFKASISAATSVRGTMEKCKFDIKFMRPGTTGPIHISGGTDNDLFFVVDHQDKKAYEDIEPAVLGQNADVVLQVMVLEYFLDEPFSNELNGKQQVLEGSKIVAGEECHEVHVVYQRTDAPEATWCFSKKDHLPRQRVDHYTLPSGEKGAITRTVTHVLVNPDFSDDIFKLSLPEGYTKTDDFAPNLLPARDHH